jgi:hypothetical protein
MVASWLLRSDVLPVCGAWSETATGQSARLIIDSGEPFLVQEQAVDPLDKDDKLFEVRLVAASKANG